MGLGELGNGGLSFDDLNSTYDYDDFKIQWHIFPTYLIYLWF